MSLPRKPLVFNLAALAAVVAMSVKSGIAWSTLLNTLQDVAMGFMAAMVVLYLADRQDRELRRQLRERRQARAERRRLAQQAKLRTTTV